MNIGGIFEIFIYRSKDLARTYPILPYPILSAAPPLCGVARNRRDISFIKTSRDELIRANKTLISLELVNNQIMDIYNGHVNSAEDII